MKRWYKCLQKRILKAGTQRYDRPVTVTANLALPTKHNRGRALSVLLVSASLPFQRNKICGISILLLSLLIVLPVYSNSTIEFDKCSFNVADHWPETRCGVVTLPESYEIDDGRSIKIPIVIIGPSNTERVPLLVTGGGGPGSGLGLAEHDAYFWDTFQWDTWWSSTVNSDRQLILMDNRGVGGSQPRLDCPEVELAQVDSLANAPGRSDYVSRLRTAYRQCKQRFETLGIDFSRYQAQNASHDIDEVRKLLGLPKINLYGISYGTRVALMYERLYPKNVRAMILDGVYPLFTRSHEDVARLDYKAFKRVFDTCNSDQRCHDIYGKDLEKRFVDFLKKLDSAPVTLTVTHPRSSVPQTVVVTPSVLVYAILNNLYDGAEFKSTPKYLSSIVEGNTDYLAELVRDQVLRNVTVDSLDEGAYASYSCFDEIPFIDVESARAAVHRYPIQHYTTDEYIDVELAICDVWNVPTMDKAFKSPAEVRTPVLIYSGEFDPTTPSEWANQLSKHARLGYARTWPHVGHGAMSETFCADSVAADFLDDPASNPFDKACIGESNPLIFDVPVYEAPSPTTPRQGTGGS